MFMEYVKPERQRLASLNVVCGSDAMLLSRTPDACVKRTAFQVPGPRNSRGHRSRPDLIEDPKQFIELR